MDMILALNTGSSSVKFSAYDVDPGELRPLLSGKVEGIGTRPRLRARDARGDVLIDKAYARSAMADQGTALQEIVAWLRSVSSGERLAGIAHRIAHGGDRFAGPAIIDDAVLALIERFCPLAPLHQPAALEAIYFAREHLPDLPQIACFDTAFHRTHPPVADHFALPRRFHEAGLKRYGFHGLSYESIVEQLPRVAPELAQGRVVVAHLGSGASMCAMKGGKSIDTTMSFSALDGLPMGTRPGGLDPAAVIHLVRAMGMSIDDVERILYRESGLLGLSGVSNDMRDLEASTDPNARFAIDYFIYRACRELGSLAGALGGLDGVVFTAGIGEHGADVRARICLDAAWLGITLDEAANRAHGPRITTDTSAISVWVIPTNEELVIARHALRLLGGRQSMML